MTSLSRLLGTQMRECPMAFQGPEQDYSLRVLASQREHSMICGESQFANDASASAKLWEPWVRC